MKNVWFHSPSHVVGKWRGHRFVLDCARNMLRRCRRRRSMRGSLRRRLASMPSGRDGAVGCSCSTHEVNGAGSFRVIELSSHTTLCTCMVVRPQLDTLCRCYPLKLHGMSTHSLVLLACVTTWSFQSTCIRLVYHRMGLQLRRWAVATID